MPLTRAEIQRRYRDRKSDNRRLIQIELDDALVEDALISRGYLSPQDADDASKVAEALRMAVTQLIRPPAEPDDVTGNDAGFRFLP